MIDRSLLKEQVLIDGKWCKAANLQTLLVTNPATAEAIARVPDCGAAETQHAIVAAEKALPKWRSTSAAQRGRVLQAWSELIVQHQDDLAALLTLEPGKPLAEAHTEVVAAAAFMQWFAEEVKRIYGDIIPSAASDRRLLVIKQPIGVCAAITPWNFPCSMIARKVAPALAAGCTYGTQASRTNPAVGASAC
jgi:succinate-semialdehyde dehydrogenase/glutarate-semialdehyde dehydrogenase